MALRHRAHIFDAEQRRLEPVTCDGCGHKHNEHRGRDMELAVVVDGKADIIPNPEYEGGQFWYCEHDGCDCRTTTDVLMAERKAQVG